MYPKNNINTTFFILFQLCFLSFIISLISSEFVEFIKEGIAFKLKNIVI